MQNSHRKRAVLWIALVAFWALIAACTVPPVAPAPDAAEADSTAIEAATAEPTAEAATEPTAEEAATTGDQMMHDGVPVGFTEEGYPYRGNPDAPITVYEYSDYECPFCARHVIQTEPALKDAYISTGQVRFVFRDMPLESLHPNAIPAAIAANCVADQGIVPYWEMHSLLFRTQTEWANMSDAGPVFARLAEEAGADPTQYSTCVAEEAALSLMPL